MSDPRVRITGPFDRSGSLSGFETELFLGSSAQVNTETETNKLDIPGRDAEDAIVTPLEGSKDFLYNGVASPQSLIQAGFGDTPQEAVKSYLIELESLVLPFQSVGYRLEDDENGITLDPTDGIGVLCDEVSWEVGGGDGLRSEYRVSAVQSDGVQETGEGPTRSEYLSDPLGESVVDPVNQLEYPDGILPLGSLDSLTLNRSVDVDAQDMLHEFDVPQVGVIETGVEVEIQYSGTVTEKELEISLDEWARELSVDAHGTQSFFEETVTGRRFQGTLSDTSTEFEGGQPNAVSFDLTFDVGNSELFS